MSDVLFTRNQLIESPQVYFQSPWQIRFQEVDAAGIVFFPRILEACHTTYVQFSIEQGGTLAQTVWRSKRWIVPLVHAEADFIRPLRFLDEASVQIVALHQTPRKIAWGFRVMLHDHVAAVAQTVHVVVDGATFQRIDVPSEIQNMLFAMTRTLPQ